MSEYIEPSLTKEDINLVVGVIDSLIKERYLCSSCNSLYEGIRHKLSQSFLHGLTIDLYQKVSWANDEIFGFRDWPNWDDLPGEEKTIIRKYKLLQFKNYLLNLNK